MGPRPSRYVDSLPDACWEVVDDEVMIRAKNYRTSLERTWKCNSFREIISSIQEFYLALDLQPLMSANSSANYNTVQEYFREAYDADNVSPVVTAYTSGTNFYKLVNKGLANLISTDNLRDIGMSPDTPTHRRYWEGSLDIACILVNHPDLDCYTIKKETKVYRGMTVPESVLANYSMGTRFMNKTFLSASISHEIAEIFKGSTATEVGCLCIYTLVPSVRRTAIEIQKLSAFPNEHEVLILPYTTFEVKNVIPGAISGHYIIELRESHDLDD